MNTPFAKAFGVSTNPGQSQSQSRHRLRECHRRGRWWSSRRSSPQGAELPTCRHARLCARCLIPGFDGALFSRDRKDALWAVLHGGATTTAATRRAIQHSQEILRDLAKHYGINPKTVAKWRSRNSIQDRPTGPKQAQSTVLSAEDEAVWPPSVGIPRCPWMTACMPFRPPSHI